MIGGRRVAKLLMLILGPAGCGDEPAAHEIPRPEPVVDVAATPPATTVTEPVPGAVVESGAPESGESPSRRGEVFEGTAAWYGKRYHGKRTAYGERFDMHALTAASAVFPYDTRLRVENVATGRAVEVRVNDRGGARGGHLVDLSRAAAETIGMIDAGNANVRVTVLAP